MDESRSKKTGSSGLGLAIATVAKEIINSHGGEIEATSEYGEGTEFHFIKTGQGNLNL